MLINNPNKSNNFRLKFSEFNTIGQLVTKPDLPLKYNYNNIDDCKVVQNIKLIKLFHEIYLTCS